MNIPGVSQMDIWMWYVSDTLYVAVAVSKEDGM